MTYQDYVGWLLKGTVSHNDAPEVYKNNEYISFQGWISKVMFILQFHTQNLVSHIKHEKSG